MNAKEETNNRTLIELVVAIMLNFGTLSHWWGKLLLIVAYVLHIDAKTKIIF